MHPQHKAMFPLNVSEPNLNTRKHNKFRVKFAKHSYYKASAIPYIQNMLNEHEHVKGRVPTKNNYFHGIFHGGVTIFF